MGGRRGEVCRKTQGCGDGRRRALRRLADGPASSQPLGAESAPVAHQSDEIIEGDLPIHHATCLRFGWVEWRAAPLYGRRVLVEICTQRGALLRLPCFWLAACSGLLMQGPLSAARAATSPPARRGLARSPDGPQPGGVLVDQGGQEAAEKGRIWVWVRGG